MSTSFAELNDSITTVLVREELTIKKMDEYARIDKDYQELFARCGHAPVPATPWIVAFLNERGKMCPSPLPLKLDPDPVTAPLPRDGSAKFDHEKPHLHVLIPLSMSPEHDPPSSRARALSALRPPTGSSYEIGLPVEEK
jgi:hypothetical protein